MDALDVFPQITPGCETELADLATPGFPVLAPFAVHQQVLLQDGLLVKCKLAHLTFEL